MNAGALIAGHTGMKLYHAASRTTASSIEKNGFRDASGWYLTDGEWHGVWVSDRPLDADELGALTDDLALFEIEIDDSLVQEFQWAEEGMGYREWLVPAAVLNEGQTRRIE
jgi:hypothetical protein